MLPAKISVFGLGYVGCVTAAGLAEIGHSVIGIDRDEVKVRTVLNGAAPFYEPGLEDIVRRNVQAGRLSATTSIEEALANSDISLICVGTPSERNGDLGLDQLSRVVESIAAQVAQRSTPLIVAIRSTVFPGVCEEIVERGFAKHPMVSVVSNPEFLRQGSAVQDFLEPSLIVVGGTRRESVEQVAALYDGLGVTPCLVSLRTAEMIKYACNVFHAVKISFANEVGALCERLEVPAAEVMDTLCQDRKLNISPAYLKPGFAFGGSCIPKDLRALVYRAARMDLALPLLEAVAPSNSEQLDRAVQSVLDLPVERIGVFGLAFKENTDDLRESPVVELIERLIGKGRNVRVFDPHIRMESIYGSNRNYILNAIPHISRLLDPTLDIMLGCTDHVVVTQKPPAEMLRRIVASGLPVLDLTSTR